MEEFYLSNMHWFDHLSEASIMFFIIVSIIMMGNFLVHGNIDYEVDYAIKYPMRVIMFNIVLFLLLIIISHVIVSGTGADIWHHQQYYEQGGGSNEKTVGPTN